ncbi:hypothetical protein DEJ73_00005, partial [Chromohalobacter salexigens]|nr:hypothetical protein [Chromohalobacter salexigens]
PRHGPAALDTPHPPQTLPTRADNASGIAQPIRIRPSLQFRKNGYMIDRRRLACNDGESIGLYG